MSLSPMEGSTMCVHPRPWSTNTGTGSCSKLDRAGNENATLFWVGHMVDRAFGACKKRDFECIHRNRSIIVRGDDSHMDVEARALNHKLDAEDVGSSRGNTTAVMCGTILPTDSNAPTESSGVGDEWMLYQIDEIGVSTHTILGYVPIETANVFCEGIAEHMDYALEFGYTALCDYNNTVSPGTEHAPGHSRILDIDTKFIGEPMFNSGNTNSSLIDIAWVWPQRAVLSMGQVQLAGRLHLSVPCEKCRLPSPTSTPLIKFKPTDMTKATDEVAARRVLAQREWLHNLCRKKSNSQRKRELYRGLFSQQ